MKLSDEMKSLLTAVAILLLAFIIILLVTIWSGRNQKPDNHPIVARFNITNIQYVVTYNHESELYNLYEEKIGYFKTKHYEFIDHGIDDKNKSGVENLYDKYSMKQVKIDYLRGKFLK